LSAASSRGRCRSGGSKVLAVAPGPKDGSGFKKVELLLLVCECWRAIYGSNNVGVSSKIKKKCHYKSQKQIGFQTVSPFFCFYTLSVVFFTLRSLKSAQNYFLYFLLEIVKIVYFMFSSGNVTLEFK
jgi:hypothetical protein